jgi:eukaryotic-like serine/threonine-protein kinase
VLGERMALTPERWEQVKKIFGAAVSSPPEVREQVVLRLCGGDSQLESEVKNLIAADKEAGSFLQAPAVEALPAYSAVEAQISFSAGQIIAGRFEIRRFLNRGGMGEVYDAWDTELQQEVALKTIRSELASAPKVISRFKREVSQTRQISHPNSCRVYDLFCHQSESTSPVWFLTMQLLEGETLLDRIRRQGPMPTAEALPLIRQMVAGISAAHELGIVHRDFKSGNVILVKDAAGQETAVITDFGLALHVDRDSSSPEPAGVGTPDYMAPEQWQGGQVSFAADQYALGVVICEMLTGARPIVELSKKSDAAHVELPANRNLDFRWERTIRRCLRARPEERYSDVRQVVTDVDPQRRRQVRQRIAAGVAVLAVAVAGGYLVVASQPDAELVNQVPFTPSDRFAASPSLSRDGTMMVYESDRKQRGNLDIYAEHLPPVGEAIRITNDLSEDGEPDISPDGATVVYQSKRKGGGIYLASTAEGHEELLAPNGKNPRFSPDGKTVAYWTGDNDDSAASGHILVMPLGTRKSKQIASTFQDARYPVWSYDGRYLLFVGCQSRDKSGSCPEWWVVSIEDTEPHNTRALELLGRYKITPAVGMGHWYHDTVLFSGEEGTTRSLWELEIPANTLRVTGRPHRLSGGESRENISSSSFAGDRTIAFTRLSSALHLWQINLSLAPKPESLAPVTQKAVADTCPSISANGKWLVFMRGLPTNRDIWLRETETGHEQMLPAPQLSKFSPLVDDSGDTVVFEATDSGVASIFVRDTAGHIRKLCSECSSPTGWLGKRVLYYGGTPSQLMLVSTESGAQPEPLLAKPGLNLAHPAWSPQNQFLLFTASAGEKRKQVFALYYQPSDRRFGRQWIPITPPSEWSDKPQWSHDGNTIYYFSDRDGHTCVWGRHFDPNKIDQTGEPFPVMHFHEFADSPARVWLRSLNLAVSRDFIYLDYAHVDAIVWIAKLKRSYIRQLFNGKM